MPAKKSTGASKSKDKKSTGGKSVDKKSTKDKKSVKGKSDASSTSSKKSKKKVIEEPAQSIMGGQETQGTIKICI